MGRELTSMRREEIERRLKLGCGVREIARALHCAPRTVRLIREGLYRPPLKPISLRPWLEQVAWDEILAEVRLGHPLKFVWESRAAEITTYSNFWKAFYQKYPELKSAAVTPREFSPGERCEIDYAGGKISWVDPKTGQVHEMPVFIAVLGFSQLLFAAVREDMKSRNFLDCHREMFEEFKGVSSVLVSDCLKQGVAKCHLYDPDLNTAYADLAKHYGTAVVPARPKHPKDKALVEGAVRIVMRYFRWRYRNHTFYAPGEIQRALKETISLLNQRRHSRFQVSRLERFEKVEKTELKPLPELAYEVVEWKEVKLHPDSHVIIEKIYYSAPHIYRGRPLRVKLTAHLVEIYHGLERVAVHARYRGQDGRRFTKMEHLPDNARAYREATPQNLLSQARFISSEIYGLIKDLFEADALGHLRRTQGLLREARKEIDTLGHDKARLAIARAIEQMRKLDRIRVPYFRELLNHFRKQTYRAEDREIERDFSNPMLRYQQQEEIYVDGSNQKSLFGNEAQRPSFVSGGQPPRGNGGVLEPTGAPR